MASSSTSSTSSPSTSNGRQTLLIDADDTLWENNIYFERAIANFISFLNHHEYSPEQVREVLNDVERECIVTHGYGLHSFAHALAQTFERLSVEPLTPALHQTIHGFTHAIAEHPIEIRPGVPETLAYLAERHRLILMTKGEFKEQSGKVERSGLKQYFSAVEIVPEKDSATYETVIAKHNLAKRSRMDDRQQPEIRHQSRAGRGTERCLPSSRRHLDSGARGSRGSAASLQLLVLERFEELREHF